MATADLGKMLKEHGLRRTAGRVEILSVLRGSRRPMTHAEILGRLKSSHINRVSVYRALETFVEAGLVHRAFVGDRIWTFEMADHCGPTQCHPHFSCSSCGNVTCMNDVSFPLAKGLPRGYTVERQQVALEGICGVCSQGKKS